jgi:hypothetical protein
MKVTIAIVGLFLAALTQVTGQEQAPRINHIQIIGTHNSYHVAPHPSILSLIAAHRPDAAASLDYTHPPLSDQLSDGIRCFELDVFLDPAGGLYTNPQAINRVKESGVGELPSSLIPSEWNQPGFPVFHVLDYDFQTRTPNVRSALTEMLHWSESHPGHFPICVMLELKDPGETEWNGVPVRWDENQLERLEEAVLSVIPRERIICPGDLTKPESTLNESILESGWPTVESSRNMFLFALDNEDGIRDQYLQLRPGLADAVLFLSLPEGHPQSAFIKINDPESRFEQIQKLSALGYLVRTRADAGTGEARLEDHSRKEKAFASGAHWISTDYPQPDARLSPYSVDFNDPASPYMRWNPVSAADLHSHAVPFPSGFLRGHSGHNIELSPETISRLAMEAHGDRNLGLASSYYRKLLAMEPAVQPDQSVIAAVLEMAPRLMLHPEEFFPLRDVCAIHHPSLPLIAYHLFWGDDIDFPEDNDPVDHEVIWVEYSRKSGRPTVLYTYFHGSIVSQRFDGNDPPVRDAGIEVAVEWGKHGSLPLAFAASHPGMRKNYERLNRSGTRLPDHPLANGWPRRFSGSFGEYATWTNPLPLAEVIQARPMILTGLHGNAILDQHFLPYNFSAKPEWPALAER